VLSNHICFSNAVYQLGQTFGSFTYQTNSTQHGLALMDRIKGREPPFHKSLIERNVRDRANVSKNRMLNC
jgi:hypothetical protein